MSTASILKALNHQHAAVRFRAPACSAVRILRVYLRPWCGGVNSGHSRAGAVSRRAPQPFDNGVAQSSPAVSIRRRVGDHARRPSLIIRVEGRLTLATQHVRRRHARAIHEDDHAFWARRLVAAVSMVARAGRVFEASQPQLGSIIEEHLHPAVPRAVHKRTHQKALGRTRSARIMRDRREGMGMMPLPVAQSEQERVRRTHPLADINNGRTRVVEGGAVRRRRRAAVLTRMIRQVRIKMPKQQNL